MKISEIKGIIHKLNSQGQIWRIFCYYSETNIKKICELAFDEKNVFYCYSNTQNDEVLKAINQLKPEYLLIFETDLNLLDITSFIYEWGGKHYILENNGYIISRKVKSNILSIDKKICCTYSKKKIEYNDIYENKVDKYWNYLMKIGKKYFNGEMYSINSLFENEDEINFQFGKTDYKHVIYSKDHDFRNDYHTCTTASLAIIETIDGYSVLGKMSNNSAFANQYKCLGGALSADDITGKRIDVNSMFRRELIEEIGLDISDQEVCISNTTKWLLIRENMAFVGVCNIIRINMTKEKFTKHFSIFQDIDKEKEITELLFVRSFNEIMAIEEHNKADYVDELYGCYYSEKTCMSWNQYKKLYCVYAY